MEYNEVEAAIIHKLEQMKRDHRYTALSLWPPETSSIIEKQNNTMLINEGREGRWSGVSEAFYDSVVMDYDSREISYRKNYE
jgi:hypothetical protein